MVLNVSGDYIKDCGLDVVYTNLNNLGFRNYFLEKQYGDGLRRVTAFLICLEPSPDLRQRIKYSKKEGVLYIDLMFDLYATREMDDATRMQLFAHKMIEEVPEVLSKYKIPDFKKDEFIKDLKDWFEKHNFC
jgi:hypothetical protein